MVLYLIGASLTFSLLLHAFLKDDSTANSDVYSWVVVVIGSLLWFVSLASIARKKFVAARRFLTPELPGQSA